MVTSRFVIAILLSAIVVALDTGAAEPTLEALTATARRTGLRVLEGDHLVLVTDRPARAGDGVEELPAVFDAAWAAWCRHYGLDPADHENWRAFGCLIVDRERFRAAGLLPDDLPDFANGFCAGRRIWLHDQSSAAYRRHLLLHEGVHAFTITLRDLDTPPWYTEGIAEYLATHRLDASAAAPGSGAANGQVFVPTPLPARPEDVEQLGRIERLRQLRRAAECPGLDAILTAPAADHRDLSAYAANWAAVTFLAQHPAHAEAFRATERGPLDRRFNARLAATPGWDAAAAARDFDAFTDEVDYGFDFARAGIDWSPGRPLDGSRTVEVPAGAGWTNTGCRLRAGNRYTFAASGRCLLKVLAADAAAGREEVRIETEPAGISLEWYRGRPLGRLLMAQWVERPADGGRPRFVVIAEGRRGEFVAPVDGVAYGRLNEPPGGLADSEGRFTVDLALRP
jgi:hypothetical protein